MASATVNIALFELYKTPSTRHRKRCRGPPPQTSPTKFCNFAGPDWGGIPHSREKTFTPKAKPPLFGEGRG